MKERWNGAGLFSFLREEAGELAGEQEFPKGSEALIGVLLRGGFFLLSMPAFALDAKALLIVIAAAELRDLLGDSKQLAALLGAIRRPACELLGTASQGRAEGAG